MRTFFGIVLILGGIIFGFRLLADTPEGTGVPFIIGLLIIPTVIALMGLRMILKKK